MTKRLALGRVREQFADLEESSLRNDNFLQVVSNSSSECLKSTHRFVEIKPHKHMLGVFGQRH